ncbi:hypothetical protein ElyMa_004380300 [Elysia marginata]|uniref:Uncharacterized protein n=1 Tax=Elysia marginata TaxID=1093978 RepID=A0AAV4H5N0_9GAST|nr:hypothetical protein ElyMa_004380300 [Elysia marginata]
MVIFFKAPKRFVDLQSPYFPNGYPNYMLYIKGENKPLVDPTHLDKTQHNLPTQVNVVSSILYGQWVLRLNSTYDGAFHPSKFFNFTVSWKGPHIFVQTRLSLIQYK